MVTERLDEEVFWDLYNGILHATVDFIYNETYSGLKLQWSEVWETGLETAHQFRSDLESSFNLDSLGSKEALFKIDLLLDSLHPLERKMLINGEEEDFYKIYDRLDEEKHPLEDWMPQLDQFMYLLRENFKNIRNK